jgi:hypothetical protein
MKQWRKYMDKRKTNGIGLVRSSMIQCSNGEVDAMENERELYNSVYREISEIVGLEATLKIYLRFKGQQVNFPVRLYNPHLIQKMSSKSLMDRTFPNWLVNMTIPKKPLEE